MEDLQTIRFYNSYFRLQSSETYQTTSDREEGCHAQKYRRNQTYPKLQPSLSSLCFSKSKL